MGSRVNNTHGDKIEQEANAFAMCILMPLDMVITEYNKMNGLDLGNDEEIQQLADKFQVSVTAMAARLAMLKLI